MNSLYWQYLDKCDRFQRIEPCEFFMGVPNWQERLWENWPDNARPIPEWRQDELYHPVRITRPFYVDRFLTTVYDFRRFVDETGYITSAEKDEKHNGSWGWGQGVLDELNNDPYWRGGGDDIQMDFAVALVDGVAYGLAERRGLFWRNVQWTYNCFGHMAVFSQQEDHPVICLTRKDVKAYLDWLNENVSASYKTDLGFTPRFRLPTEAENECFSHGGTFSIYPWGDDLESASKYANVADEAMIRLAQFDWVRYFPHNPLECVGVRKPFYLFTSPVGAFEPNNFGLYDVVGNVAEMVADVYDVRYGLDMRYQNEVVVDPLFDVMPQGVNEDEVVYVSKGGSWASGPAASRVVQRFHRAARFRSDALGFRICFSAEEEGD